MPYFTTIPGDTGRDPYAEGIAPLDVFDADEALIDRKVHAFDTDTGVVTVHAVNSKGEEMYHQGEAVRVQIVYKAPLTWKSIRSEDRKVQLLPGDDFDVPVIVESK